MQQKNKNKSNTKSEEWDKKNSAGRCKKTRNDIFYGQPKIIDPPPLPHKKANQMYLSYSNPIHVIRVQPNAG